MRLQDKKTIATQVAGQRKSQIDEGIILATKIDKLRATHSSLEKQHNEYVAGLKSNLEQTLGGLEEGIKAKKKELVLVEEERQKLLEPLDQAWDEVREKQVNLDVLQEELYEKRTFLTLSTQDLNDREENIALKEEKLKEERNLLDIQIEKVTKTSLEAQKVLSNAREEANSILSSVKTKELKLNKLEEELIVRERELEIQSINLEKEKQTIIKEKIVLADQRKTLERAMARISW